jgi:hypothetical protein
MAVMRPVLFLEITPSDTCSLQSAVFVKYGLYVYTEGEKPILAFSHPSFPISD